MITVEQNENHCKLALSGEIGIYNISTLKQGLMESFAGSESMEIDLSQVSEIDTAGLQLLMCAKKEADRLTKTLRLSNHSDAVIQVFDLYNVSALFGDPVVLSAK